MESISHEPAPSWGPREGGRHEEDPVGRSRAVGADAVPGVGVRAAGLRQVLRPERLGPRVRDLALPEDYQVLPLDDMLKGQAFDVEAMAEWHSALWKQGTVEMCLTCVASVHAALVEQGLPSQRIFHTRSGIREVLTRLGLWQRLSRAEATQTAIGLVVPRAPSRARVNTDTDAVVRRAAKRYAELLGADIAGAEGGLLTLHTTNDAVARELIDARTDDSLDDELREDTVAGFGLGTTREQAMQEARVQIDPFRDAAEQTKKVVDALRVILPLKSEKVRLKIVVPAQFAPQSIGALKSFGELQNEQWGADGSLTTIIEIPAGVRTALLERLGSATKGAAQAVEVK